MTPEEIQDVILMNCPIDEPITKELLWIKCSKPNRNKFTIVLRDMIKNGWIKKTKEGLIRIKFSKENSIGPKLEWLEKWCVDTRKIIVKHDKPLFKVTKKGEFYLTKHAEQNLTTYFYQCDYHTLNLLNRNFLAFRLKLISPNEYKKNIKLIEDRFDYLFFSLINDHKSFKKQLIDYYLKTVHRTGFIV